VATTTEAAGSQSGLAAFDVEKLLRPEIGAETRLGHDVVGELQGGLCGDHRIAAVRDVRKGTAVDEGRGVFDRLDQIRGEGILEQRRHRPVGLEIGGGDIESSAVFSDTMLSEAVAEIGRDFGRGRKIAITSEATVMLKPVSRVKSRSCWRPVMISLRERSFRSIARFQVMRRGSRSRALPQWR
jgi:hypothetical protein